jgi:hypothetical protein
MSDKLDDFEDIEFDKSIEKELKKKVKKDNKEKVKPKKSKNIKNSDFFLNKIVQVIFATLLGLIVLLSITSVILGYSLFTTIKINEKNNKELYQKTYSFNKFLESDIITDRSVRKENFIKQSMVIFDKYDFKFDEEQRKNIAVAVFEYQEFYHISGLLCYSFMFVESGGDNTKVGKYGEITALQFLKTTWSDAVKGRSYSGCEKDIVFVIETWYIFVSELNAEFTGYGDQRLRRVFLAYNAGKQAIIQLKDVNDLNNFQLRIYKDKNGESIVSYADKIFNTLEDFRKVSVE